MCFLEVSNYRLSPKEHFLEVSLSHSSRLCDNMVEEVLVDPLFHNWSQVFWETTFLLIKCLWNASLERNKRILRNAERSQEKFGVLIHFNVSL